MLWLGTIQEKSASATAAAIRKGRQSAPQTRTRKGGNQKL